MGPKTGHIEHDPRSTRLDISPVVKWLGMQMGNDEKWADEVASDFPPLKGWKVDIMSVLGDAELTKNLTPGLIPLAPGNNETRKQWKQWEQELGGPILFLIVPRYKPGVPDPNASPWLAQPVKREWLTTTPIRLLMTQYEERGEQTNWLRLRAAIIARTGYPPEIVPPDMQH